MKEASICTARFDIPQVNKDDKKAKPTTFGLSTTAKPIVAKTKAKAEFISLMYLGMADFGTINPTSLMSAHVKGPQQNKQNFEKDILHQDRKWYYNAHGEESVVAYAQRKDDIKQTTTT